MLERYSEAAVKGARHERNKMLYIVKYTIIRFIDNDGLREKIYT